MGNIKSHLSSRVDVANTTTLQLSLRCLRMGDGRNAQRFRQLPGLFVFLLLFSLPCQSFLFIASPPLLGLPWTAMDQQKLRQRRLTPSFLCPTAISLTGT